MGATERQTFFKVVLPAASPWIITAMKVGVPFALVGAIVGEFMAATAGLGLKIQLYTAQFDTTGAVTGVLVLMVVVIMFNTALNRLEAHVLRWRPEIVRRGGIGHSIEIGSGEIAMAEQRRNPNLSRRTFAAGSATLVIGAPAIVRAQGLVKVRITQPAESLSYMPIYVGRAKEFFKEAGIDLELVVTRGDGPDVQALWRRRSNSSPPRRIISTRCLCRTGSFSASAASSAAAAPTW